VFGGHSVVIDPWGNELPKIKSPDPHLLNFIIDTEIVARVREKMPVLKDRRPDLYQT
jgi:predicted amidohydrolase